MDNNNWRPTPPGGEPNMETPDWRTQLQPDSRQRIVNEIMDILKRQLPFSGPEGLNELKKIAGRFEEKIYTAATNQWDYLKRISLKMLSMESKSQTTMSNSLQPNSGGTSNKPPDPESDTLTSTIEKCLKAEKDLLQAKSKVAEAEAKFFQALEIVASIPLDQSQYEWVQVNQLIQKWEIQCAKAPPETGSSKETGSADRSV